VNARLLLRAAVVALALTAATAQARDLVFGRGTEQASIDPHFNDAGNDVSTNQNIFDRLIEMDAQQTMQPGLALSWRALDPLRWEIRLRPGVTFHDGSPFGPQDVAFSLERPRHLVGAAAPWTRSVASVAGVDIVDDTTVIVRTKEPKPLLMDEIGNVFIVSRKAAENATTEDFNSGRAAIGTGPYSFVSWRRGDRVELRGHKQHWRGKPEFDRVTLRFIPTTASRIADLMAGSVDVIDGVPPNDVPTIAARKELRVWSGLTNRITFLAIDSPRAATPFATDLSGEPLPRNPLADMRVRRALSKMVNRPALVERIAGGQGVVAGQIVPPGQGGYAPDLLPDTLDLDAARGLLAEAGYPKGFGLTIHSSNDRFPEDSAVLQALGQMFTRGGIRVNGVVSMPFNVMIGQAAQQKFSLFLWAYNSGSPDASEGLKSLLATRVVAAGMGGSNRTQYSNAAFDALLAQGLAEFDDEKRNAIFADAARLAIRDDVGIIPLYWQKHAWGTRADLTYEANVQDDNAVRFVHLAR
jgi:peptide/nickel transport system substrate-binding protein